MLATLPESVPAPHSVDNAFEEYFRCPAEFATVPERRNLSERAGFFQFERALCYGRAAEVTPSPDLEGSIPTVSARAGILPFDLAEVVDNLQRERYVAGLHRQPTTSMRLVRQAYYAVRPLLQVPLRKHLQRLYFRGWESLRFPAWPVDATVQRLMRWSMREALLHSDVERLPFVWFWPDGWTGCVLMTHDVEGAAGRDFCSELMRLDEAFGMRAAFQIIPESVSGPDDPFIVALRSRGFEVNVHDLHHNGTLFEQRDEFVRLAHKINAHAKRLESRGFRAGAMYRQQNWYDALDVSYDMSVPNVAHLEPQRGGCCTVMPYFVGNIVELPLTTTQDYSLFHVLGDYSIDLWRRQIAAVCAESGLVSFIVHPDYIATARAQRVYVGLLRELSKLRTEKRLWIALPGEVDRWWRTRAGLTVGRSVGRWRVEGPGADRARLAFARLRDGEVVYEMAPNGS